MSAPCQSAVTDRRYRDSKDLLGRVYDCLLGQFASAEGKKGGQFCTPCCVVQLLLEMLAPWKGRVFDPGGGSGGMFVQIGELAKAHATGNGHGGKAKGDLSVFGQESNPTTWRPAKMNLAIRGIEGDLMDCMVALPGQLFYSTQIPVCWWFLTRDKTHRSHGS